MSIGIRDDLKDHSLFAIRGSLDGDNEREFLEREQFIGLHIAKEEFYLPISRVSEIVMLQPITYVPESHEYIEGVINLRGTILPAINLRKMMGIARGKHSPSVRIIITRHLDIAFGIIVDGITFVASLLPSEIEDQSLPSRHMGADLISRISKKNDRIIGIIDIVKILYNITGDDNILEDSKLEDSH